MAVPEQAKLYKSAEQIARKMGVELAHPPETPRAILTIDRIYPTNHFIQVLSRQGTCDVFAGAQGQGYVQYSGRETATGETIEALYVTTPQKTLCVTWGYPPGVGVVEVTDILSSRALSELSGVERGPGGRSTIVYNGEGPEPRPSRGVAQFRDTELDKLEATIDILLR